MIALLATACGASDTPDAADAASGPDATGPDSRPADSDARDSPGADAAASDAASGAGWRMMLDPSRAIDWTSVGFAIPNYAANCATQPVLRAGDPSAAAANSAAIQSALASCDATHNVVNIPAGSFYVGGITYGRQGRQVLRGAGPNATTLLPSDRASCAGVQAALCMIDGDPVYGGNPAVLPPTGPNQCAWTGGLSQGSTTITLSNCGGAPPLNQMIILDQQNDTSDTGGVYICDASSNPDCAVEDNLGPGRAINGIKHSIEQVTFVTGVTSLGGGSYSVTISPGVYFNNIRASQTPGAWWSGFVQNDGLENLTVDGTPLGVSTDAGTLTMFDCYQCWARNVRFIRGGRHHIDVFQSANDVIRDSYFYQASAHGARSYGIELDQSSGFLIENNIFQQVTAPIMFGTGTGYVVGYNFSIYHYGQPPYYSHTAGDMMGLWEGNSFYGIWTDDVHGTSATATIFRNLLNGWESGTSYATMPIAFRSHHRGNNVVGNILGQPSYATMYESYASSTSGGVNAADANTSIFEFGFSDYSGLGNCEGSSSGHPGCDPLVRSTTMRWGNYDTVSNAVRWDATEASPGAVPYLNANFTSAYFGSLPHTLPASLYYSSRPPWWPSATAWPAIGPDVSSGDLGVCTGTYAGAKATVSAQCTGGALTAAYAGHANANPAQRCFLNVMHGPPDGSGDLLNFDASLCYASH